jgi:hypothetical protein
MILTKEIKIELTNFNYHHYKKIGYDTDNKDFIMVRIEDVGLKSNIKIDTECDVCDNIKSITYNKYNKNISHGGFYTCSNRCAIVKGEKTCLEKYGSKYALQNEDVKENLRKYFINKFGYDNPSKNTEVQNKRNITMMKRFGAKTNIILPETHKKAIEASCSIESKEKRVITMLERYGVENSAHYSKSIDKKKKTNIERYGYEYPAQNKDIFDKTQLSQLKMNYYKEIRYQGTYELHFLEFCDSIGILSKVSKIKSIKYMFNNNEKYYHPDFLIEKLNLIVEVKSDYYYDLYLEKNLSKEKACIEQGYDFIFIINKDYDNFKQKIGDII